MQSDSSSCKLDLSNDATTSRQANDAWVKGLENLESMFTDCADENKINKEDKLKDVTSPAFPSASDVVRGCLSPSNLFNNCTNRSTDNSSDKPIDRPGKTEKSEKQDDKADKISDEKGDLSAESRQSPEPSNEPVNELCPTRSTVASTSSDDSENESEKMETSSKSSSESDEEMNEAIEESAENDRSEPDDQFDEKSEEENSEEDKQDGEDEEEEKEESKKKSKKRKAFNERKNIKKLIKEEDLDEAVLAARREEEERINRILGYLKSEQKQELQLSGRTTARPQTEDIVLSSDEDDCQVIELSEDEKSDEDIIKVYEKIPEELDAANSGLHTDDTLNRLNKDGRCLINVGHPSDEPDVFLDDYLARKVKPHQIGGVRFMYDCIIESITKVKTSDGIGGCILAHSMGKLIFDYSPGTTC